MTVLSVLYTVQYFIMLTIKPELVWYL